MTKNLFLPHPLHNFFLVLSGALLVSLGAWLAFPVPGTSIPQTGQTIAVLLVGALLGPKRGAMAIVLYLFAGVLGFPVYSDGASGWAVLSGISAGYFTGFILAASLCGFLLGPRQQGNALLAFAVFILGHILILLSGGIWMSINLGLSTAWNEGILPFLYGGLVKSCLATAFLSFKALLGERTALSLSARP